MNLRAFQYFVLTLFLAMVAVPAHAYVGPGIAVAFVGYLFGPVIAIIVAIGLVLIWPARWLWKKLKKKNAAAEGISEATVEEETKPEA